MNRLNFVPSTLLGILAIALSILLGSSADATTQMKCETQKVRRCDAKGNGELYNCRDEIRQKCTPVSGPGSGKMQNSGNNPGKPVNPRTMSPRAPSKNLAK